MRAHLTAKTNTCAVRRTASPPWSVCAGRPMELQSDYAELLELFNEHKVKYLVVGAYALAFYGAPRTTGDIDILVQPSKETM